MFYYEKYIMALSVICCSSFIFLFVDPNFGSFYEMNCYISVIRKIEYTALAVIPGVI